MKIGLTICEYNPFHNGHLYSLNKIKEELKPDALVVIMSGNFTQRGEIAVMNKYQRATQAIKAGADMVIELPTVFATAPAEIFAKGAVKLLNSLKGEKTLCFGVESGTKSGLIATATALSQESNEYKEELKNALEEGVSLAKAKQIALEKCNLDEVIDLSLLSSPNNILAIEYVKAIIQGGFPMDILPILREGAGYKELSTDKKHASAMAIRKAIKEGNKQEISCFVPDFVYNALPNSLPNCDDAVMNALITTPAKELAKITDCTEGLENRIKAKLKDNFTREELINAVYTKRYPKTRISRITLACLLGVTDKFTKKCLNSNLYLKVLAIRQDKLNLLSELLGKTPFIMRKKDALNLNKTALSCFEKDVTANDLYNQLTKTKTNEYYTEIVKK